MLVLVFGASGRAAADPAAPPSPVGREIWAGADVSSDVWLAYTGVTWAPWSGIHDQGLRFRATGGYGQYRYSYNLKDSGEPDIAAFSANTYYGDLLVGYLMRFGELTAKGFVGLSTVTHNIAPLDDRALNLGDEIGPKAVVELWLNIGERGWGSLDLAWTSAHETRSARTRIGYRFWPKLSLGFEAAINVDEQANCRLEAKRQSSCFGDSENPEQGNLLDYARAGAFARYEWDRGEISLSAGALGDSFSSDGETEISPYVTINWLTQF